MPFNNGYNFGVKYNPLGITPFFQNNSEGNVAPGAPKFLITEDGRYITTEDGRYIITEN